MKKIIISVLISGLAVVAPIERAHSAIALVAFATGGAAASLATVGGASVGGSLALTYMGCAIDGGKKCNGNGGLSRLSVPAIALLIIGVVLLDKDGQTVYNYSPLSYEAANQIGITDDEADAYNSELDQANAIRETIMSEMLEAGHVSVNEARSLWQAYKSQLSPGTFSAIQKIGEQFAKAK